DAPGGARSLPPPGGRRAPAPARRPHQRHGPLPRDGPRELPPAAEAPAAAARAPRLIPARGADPARRRLVQRAHVAVRGSGAGARRRTGADGAYVVAEPRRRRAASSASTASAIGAVALGS